MQETMQDNMQETVQDVAFVYVLYFYLIGRFQVDNVTESVYNEINKKGGSKHEKKRNHH